jgi:hypothetical protein
LDFASRAGKHHARRERYLRRIAAAGADLLASRRFCLFSFAMKALLKEVVFVIALIAALFAAAWFTEPTENFLRTGRTCHEIRERLAAKQYRDLMPAEETDMANCN